MRTNLPTDGSLMSFNQLNISPKILKALEESGYKAPTDIQIKAIPKILSGFDIRGSAQTGTGKTGAFLIPIIQMLTAPSTLGNKGARALVLVPTRELAMQVEQQAIKYSRFLSRMKTVCLVGGVPYHKQISKLAKPYDILIATPGRLIDYINQKKIKFSRLEMLVLDEADRMLDMGFLESVEEIVEALPEKRQTLLFSATMQGSVMELSNKLLTKPLDIVVHAKHAKHDNITQKLFSVDNLGHKHRILENILNSEDINGTIIFTSTKRHAEQLAEELNEKGYPTASLHGDMKQGQRTRTLKNLKLGKFKTLVATDVAARGIDLQSITHVINFDLPRNPDDYVHRIGRTGRAGAKGTAVSFASHKDRPLVKRIEEFTGQRIDKAVIPGLEPSKKAFKENESQRPRHNNNQNRRGGKFRIRHRKGKKDRARV